MRKGVQLFLLALRVYKNSSDWFLFSSPILRAIIVVRGWALLAHGVCNRRFYLRDMSSSSSPVGVVMNLHSQSHLCNLLN